MQNNSAGLLRLTCFAVLLFLLVWFLIAARSLLAPLAFGALLAFMLKPVCGWFERLGLRRIPAIILTLLAAILPVAGIAMLFSTQIASLFQDMGSIGERLEAGAATLFSWVNEKFGYSRAETELFIREQASKLLQGPLSSMGMGLPSTMTAFLGGFFLTIAYIFLFLLYRSAIRKFILIQVASRSREAAEEMLQSIQRVVQDYLYGLALVILVLTALITLGLWLIGIKHALLWGALTGCMAVIPYIGSFLGGFLPFLYALATGDHAWQPWGVIGISVLVQFLEGNIITPNIVGSSIHVNPLAAIVALIAGAQVWGMAGVVLALPAVAVLKEVMARVDFLKPVSLLLSSEVYAKDEVFEEKLDKERFRLRSFFNKK